MQWIATEAQRRNLVFYVHSRDQLRYQLDQNPGVVISVDVHHHIAMQGRLRTAPKFK